jgi:hypothetical protein
MGKPHLVSLMCKRLDEEKFVLAVATTGEYTQRLGFASWPAEHPSDSGSWVYEPAGDPPERAKSLVHDMMTKAVTERIIHKEIDCPYGMTRRAL